MEIVSEKRSGRYARGSETAILSGTHVIKAFIHTEGNSRKLLSIVYADRQLDDLMSWITSNRGALAGSLSEPNAFRQMRVNSILSR